MISKDKNYKTADGRKVVIGAIDSGIAHCFIECEPEFVNNQLPITKWAPTAYEVSTGMPHGGFDDESEWAQKVKLVECKPTKTIHRNLFVYNDGDISFVFNPKREDELFADLTIAVEVEESESGRCVHIKAGQE